MKLYRVYFNRLNEAPQIWSVDEGEQTTEINVIGVSIHDCVVETKCDLKETVNRDRPRAWLEVRGMLSVAGGIAVIRGEGSNQ